MEEQRQKSKSEIVGENKKSMPELSVDSQTLIHRLEKQVEANDHSLISYNELTELIDRDVQNGARGNLQTARNHILNEYKRLFVVVRSEGIQLAGNDGVVAQVKGRVKKIRGQARRTAKESMAADFDTMPPEQRQEFLAAQSNAGTIALMTKPSAVKKLEARVAGAANALPTAKVLDFFRT